MLFDDIPRVVPENTGRANARNLNEKPPRLIEGGGAHVQRDFYSCSVTADARRTDGRPPLVARRSGSRGTAVLSDRIFSGWRVFFVCSSVIWKLLRVISSMRSFALLSLKSLR
ncbi:hypothetical protein EVAR_11352_1 [Eumeta japonica]|uniref:Uncharacterized protein n=1 Tax=Eumeta variegata TaxID=151549 RepID=A0A4C1U0V1_EUMVA|nr:hypothetical protein EVAR_11352_1 [Eumeta japonica]